MYAPASDDVIHIQRFLSANCFGDFVARSGIDLRTRELLTFSMLVALGGADAQVKGHVAGNLNVGNDRAKLLAVLTQLLPFIGYPRTLNGLNTVNEIAPPGGN
jgi:4-carboxymuconolactone decarboxylase